MSGASTNWTQRYLSQWRAGREHALRAAAQMISQYICPQTSDREFEIFEKSIDKDWRVICEYISPNRVITSARVTYDDEKEAMLVSIHCLCVVTWEKMYNKYHPEIGNDVYHDFMSAGEDSVFALVNLGLMEPLWGGGKWTSEGIDMLNGKLR